MKLFCLCLCILLIASMHAAAVGPITGSTIAVCGLNNVAYSVPADTSIHLYTWSVPVGAVINGGQGTHAITVNFCNTYTPGYISVVATLTSGTNSDSLLVSGVPTVPTIDPPGPYCKGSDNVYTLTSTNATTFYWNLSSTIEFDVLSGDSSQVYVIWDGSGTVQARNSCGLSDSLVINILDCATGVNPLKNESVFNAEVFPNPAAGKATVSFNSTVSSKYRLALLDLSGRELMMKEDVMEEGLNNVELDLNDLAKGMYIISFTSGDHFSRIRLAVE